MQLVFATKIISAVMAVVFGLSAVGGGAALAAQASIPGDALYPVKLTSEDVALALASAPEGQVELALRFADQRVAEAQALVERGQQVPETVVARMEQHIWRAMNQAAWASDEEMPGLLEQIMQRTRAQAQALEPLQTRAHEQNRARLENAWRTCQQAHEEAMAGLQDPQAFRSRYQQRTGMPEDITPPEPPTRGPQEGEAGPHGPAEPGQNRASSPQGEQQGDLDRERDREQDQDRDPQQDRNCSQQQDQDCDPEQDRDRDRQQDQDGDQQQDQDRDRQQDQDGDQQQDQDQEQQQDPQQGEPQQGAQQDQGQQGPQQGQQQDQGGDQQQDQQQDHQQDGQQDQQQDQQPDQQPGPRHGP